ncbi:MAG: hypothetical protein ACPL25_09485 [Ignavibacteria bacterium]
MEIITSVLIILVYLTLMSFLVYLIFFLKGLSSSIKNIEKNIADSSNQLNSTLEHFKYTLDEVSNLSKSIQSELEQLSSTLEVFKETAKDYKRIKDKVVSTIEEPIDELHSNARALVKGIRVFFQTLFKRSQ